MNLKEKQTDKERTRQTKRIVLVIRELFGTWPMEMFQLLDSSQCVTCFSMYFWGQSLSLGGRYLIFRQYVERKLGILPMRTGMGDDIISNPCNHGQFAVTRKK